MLRPSVILRRNALYKGLFGGSRAWLAVGAVIWGRGTLKKVFGKHEEVLTTEKLRKRQFVRIDTVPPPTQREKRRSKRSAKALERERAVAVKRAKVERATAKAAASKAAARAKSERRAARRAARRARRGATMTS
jgi:hypothetical protein